MLLVSLELKFGGSAEIVVTSGKHLSITDIVEQRVQNATEKSKKKYVAMLMLNINMT